jgi:hypothetical protein
VSGQKGVFVTRNVGTGQPDPDANLTEATKPPQRTRSMQPQLLDNVRKITNPLNLAGLPFCHRVKRCLRIGTALHQSRLNRNFLRARLASGPGHGSTFLAPLLSRETIFPVVGKTLARAARKSCGGVSTWTRSGPSSRDRCPDAKRPTL